MKLMMNQVLRAGCFCAVLLASSGAMAQQPPPPPGPPPMGPHGGPDAMHGPRMKEIRAKVLRSETGLDEATAAKAEKVIDQFDEQRRSGQKAVGEAHRALAELQAANSTDEAAYKKGLDALIAAHRAMQDQRVRELDELRKVLSQRDCAKVVLSLQKIQQAMRREMKQARKAWLKGELQRMDDDDDDGPAGPPPPPPPPGKGQPGRKGR